MAEATSWIHSLLTAQDPSSRPSTANLRFSMVLYCTTVSVAENSQDLRNHGESPHDMVHDYLSMAADVEEFIQHHKLKLPGLIGHSM